MSRRRKYAGSPSPKSTSSNSAAAEEGSWRVEPGRRRLRSARRSEPRGPGEGSPAAASSSKSHPKEKYETPRRMLRMDLPSCTFTSPNDPDGQNDIFWDQNSPMTKQLGRRKQIYTTDSDVISHIVNRIAPQDDRPTTNSMLGIWIGETAIPCTPIVAKEKSKGKISCTKLKTQNREKELMKLAKQFDKNMEELDVMQEQNKINHDFIQIISDTETLPNCEDCVQMHSPCDIVPEIDNATLKKPVEGITWIPGTNYQTSSQKPFDQNTEAAFNAIFDGSTQKCSGQLSQDLPDTLLYNSNTTVGKKSILTKESIITSENLVTEKLLGKTSMLLSPQGDTPTVTNSYVTPKTKVQEESHKHMVAVTSSDFEEDWECLLGNEPFVMQNIEMLELFPSKTAQANSMLRTNASVDTRVRDSKILQGLPSDTQDQGQRDAAKYRCSPNPNSKTSKLLLTGNKMKSEKSFNKIVTQDKTEDCAIASNLTKIKANVHMNFTSNINTSGKKSLNTKFSSEPKNQPVFKHCCKAPVNIDPFGSVPLVSETGVSNSNQTNTSKLDSFFDDWNDPLFANEIIKTCHKLETTWETNDVDDDLLYQACDDIERLSQQQDIKDSKSTLEIKSKSRHGAEGMPTLSKGGSHLKQPKHWNLGSISVQTSFLTNNSQITKPMKMEKNEFFGNSPHILATTTNLTMCSKNLCEINNVHESWSNSDIAVHVASSKSVLSRSLDFNVSSDHASTETVTSKKSNAQRLSSMTITGRTPSDINKTGSSSKYTFTKLKNSRVFSQLNQNCRAEHMTATKITPSLEKKTVNSWAADQQQSLVKLSESSKEEEEKYRKYSPEEIRRKRQEALVRRMAKSQASSVNSAPSQFL